MMPGILYEVKSISFFHFFVIIIVFVSADGNIFRQITAGKTIISIAHERK